MNFLRLLCGLVWLWGSAGAWGWSAAGHGDIAVAALAHLPEPAQAEYRELLLAGPWAKGAKGTGAPGATGATGATQVKAPWRTAAARAAAWPDRIRDQPLRKLFGRYGSGKVPRALAAYRKQNTSTWHYTNSLFLSPQGELLAAGKGRRQACPPAEQGELLEIWPALLRAYDEVTDRRDKALLLAFILHMAADAYQPLHLLGSLDQDCDHDRGGNAFCLVPATGFVQGQRCEESLHHLWDQGFGAFDGELAGVDRFRGEPARLEPALDEARAVAREIYPRRAADARGRAYRTHARAEVTRLARRAAGHLAVALKVMAKP